MKRFCCALLLLINIFILPPILPAAMLAPNMSTFNGTLKKITETAEHYKIKIGDKDFQIAKDNRNLMKNAQLMVGKKVTVNYLVKGHKIQSLNYFKAATPK